MMASEVLYSKSGNQGAKSWVLWEGWGGEVLLRDHGKGREPWEERGSEASGEKEEGRRSWNHIAPLGPGSHRQVAPRLPGGEPRRPALPLKESTVGRYEDLLGPAVPLSSEGIKNKLLRAST